MRKTLVFALALVPAMVLVGQVRADEVGDLKKEVERQYDVLLKMQAKLLELEEGQKKNSAAIAETSATAPAPGSLAEKLQWVEKLRITGDFRYRHENQDFDTRSDERDRQRIRARIKLEADVTDEWSVIFRLASGSSDSPTSTNQTLGESGAGDGFSSKDIWLDLAYADWHPLDGLNVMLGKMDNPFYAAGKHQLIWDGDVTPEGIAAGYAFALSEATSAQVTGGGFWLEENSSGSDAAVWGVQGMLKHKLDDGSHIAGGVSYYDFVRLEGNAFSNLSQKGNTWTGGMYAYDYNILEAFGEYGFKIGDMPFGVYGTHITNTAGGADEDQAWALGCTVNKAKNPGSWQFGYEYRDVEADAVVAGLSDSDFIDGGTGGKGHKFSLAYQLSKNIQAGLTYFMAERHDNRITGYDGQDMNLFQGDIVIKF